MKKEIKIKSILKSGIKYNVENKALSFLPGNNCPRETAGKECLGKLKNWLKKYAKTYSFLVNIFSPVCSSRAYNKTLKFILKKYREESVIINIGSGPSYLMKRKDIINVDMFAFDNVDIVSNASELPFDNEKVDLVLNIAMLEHIKKPESVVNEILRILKPGGIVFGYLPFIVPFHAAPNDYQRWTKNGVKELFSSFENIDVIVGSGPTSGMLWIFEEWISTILSFGNRKVHDILFLLSMIIFFPIKYLDLIMNRFKYSDIIASGFFITAKKNN